MSKIDKREEILKAALQLIAEHGFHGAPMAMIADKAGVGAGTIYRYFENKDVLINDLYRQLEDRIMLHVSEGYSQQMPIKERYLHLTTALLNYLSSHPLVFRYMEQFHNSPYGTEIRRDRIIKNANGCDAFRELFQQGIQENCVKDAPLVILFDLTFGPLISVTRDHILGFISLDNQLINQVVEACWDGICRHPNNAD